MRNLFYILLRDVDAEMDSSGGGEPKPEVQSEVQPTGKESVIHPSYELWLVNITKEGNKEGVFEKLQKLRTSHISDTQAEADNKTINLSHVGQAKMWFKA